MKTLAFLLLLVGQVVGQTPSCTTSSKFSCPVASNFQYVCQEGDTLTAGSVVVKCDKDHVWRVQPAAQPAQTPATKLPGSTPGPVADAGGADGRRSGGRAAQSAPSLACAPDCKFQAKQQLHITWHHPKNAEEWAYYRSVWRPGDIFNKNQGYGVIDKTAPYDIYLHGKKVGTLEGDEIRYDSWGTLEEK